jgi:pantoate--beta-alanine ligase
MTPVSVTTAAELAAAVRQAKARGERVGLVPTMGALHAGHASLIRAARQETGFVVVSIFVNPTQFGPAEDFARYPRTPEHDLAVCAAERADLVFAPPVEEVYPPGFCTFVEVTGLQDVLCGRSRPGHFRGVATVVLKLLNLVQPDVAYFGQKDAQQVRIIRQMVRDLNVPVEVRVCPIVREPDGLALSSRNAYLTPEQRRHATALYRALTAARELVEAGERDAGTVRAAMAGIIAATPGAVLDYADVVDAETLRPVPRIAGKVLAALAVKFGATRLIDNLLLTV